MWTIKKGVKTPKGLFTPDTDDITSGIMKAAEYAGLESFNVLVDGEYVDTPEDLEVTNFSEVTTVEIEPYDTAG